MVGLGPICQQLVFAARPEYLSLTNHYMSGCSKYKGTTCLHISTTHIYCSKIVYTYLPHVCCSKIAYQSHITIIYSDEVLVGY